MKLYSLSLLCCAAALRPSTRGIRKSVFYATSTRKRTQKPKLPQLDTTTDERVVHMDDIPIYPASSEARVPLPASAANAAALAA